MPLIRIDNIDIIPGYLHVKFCNKISLIQANNPESLSVNINLVPNLTNSVMYMGEIMNNPKGSEIRYSAKSEHFLSHMWYLSRFTQNNWKPVIVTVGEQTSVKFINKVCVMTIEFPKDSLKFP